MCYNQGNKYCEYAQSKNGHNTCKHNNADNDFIICGKQCQHYNIVFLFFIIYIFLNYTSIFSYFRLYIISFPAANSAPELFYHKSRNKSRNF
ncbi:MAG TPA: hypothetical protein DD738_08505 [Ruminiclostridium sp.]|nr:hypothetical protein [Ruminiclostridium sp.]